MRTVTGCTLLASLALLAGCPGVDLETLNTALDLDFIVGGNANRVVFAHTDVHADSLWDAYTQVLAGESDRFADTTYKVLDPATGTLEPLPSALLQGDWSDVSEGEWMVQNNESSGEIGIVDLHTGSSTTLNAADFGLDPFVLIDVAKPFLIVTDFNYNSSILLDAVERRVVFRVDDPNWSLDAVTGDYALASVWSDDEADWLGAVVDLATGESTMLPESRSFGLARIVGDKGYWLQQDEEGTVRVRTVTLATGATETLYEIPAALAEEADTDTFSYALDFSEAGLLILEMTYPLDANQAIERLRWHPREGTPIILATWDHTLPTGDDAGNLSWILNVLPDAGFDYPELAGDSIVFRNPTLKQWQIYDLPTGQTRSFVPFP